MSSGCWGARTACLPPQSNVVLKFQLPVVMIGLGSVGGPTGHGIQQVAAPSISFLVFPLSSHFFHLCSSLRFYSALVSCFAFVVLATVCFPLLAKVVIQNCDNYLRYHRILAHGSRLCNVIPYYLIQPLALLSHPVSRPISPYSHTARQPPPSYHQNSVDGSWEQKGWGTGIVGPRWAMIRWRRRPSTDIDEASIHHS